MSNRGDAQAPLAPDTMTRKTSWLFVLFATSIAVFIAPYRRTFKLYTWTPLKEIRAAGGDRNLLIPLVRDWQADKYAELQSVQVAASFCAGAALSTLPWTRTQNPIWVADALWFSSLILSIWAIITSIQTKSLLDDLPSGDQLDDSLSKGEVERMRRSILRYRKSPGINHWIMLFLWQSSSMFMAYSWCTFLAGLTVYLATPFIRHEPWSNKHKIAIVYFAVGGLGLITYVFSTVFVYLSERDHARSRASTSATSRTNKIDPEIGGSSNGVDMERTRQDSNGINGLDPVLLARERVVVNRRTNSEKLAGSKRQLLI